MNNQLLKFLSVAAFIAIVLIAVGLYVSSQNNKESSSSDNKIQVSASFYPMYFFASQIGGDKVNVTSITPASAEPHDYEPTARDIAKIEESKLLVLNGGALEAWGDKIKTDLQGKGTVVVVAGDSLVTKQMVEEGKTIRDPHVWLDPVFAKVEASNIEKGLEKVDPGSAPYFQANLKKLDDSLDALDADYQAGLRSCKQNDFVTSHAAFAYLSQRYGITQIPIAGVSPDEEPSTQKLAEISNLIKQKNIKIIFFESLVSPKLSQTLASETGAKSMVLDPIEGITHNDMAAGHTYLTVMKSNLNALRTALACN